MNTFLPSHPARRWRRQRLALSAAAAVLAVGTLAACGDDDADASIDREACDAFATMNAAMMGDPSAMGPASQTLVDRMPGDLTDDAKVIAAAVTAMLESEDPSGFESPEFASSYAAVGEALYDGCDAAEKLDVKGVDFGFEGLPDQVKAGRVAIRFTNATQSGEAHEIMLFRRLEGTTETVEELFELPEEEVFQKVQPVGVAFADTAGDTSVSLMDLEAGQYIALCMIPVGGGEDGPPHALHGMVAELSVA